MSSTAVHIPRKFFVAAQANQSSYKDARSWARTYARDFYHSVSSDHGFLPVYQTLLSMSNLPFRAPEDVKKAKPAFETHFDSEFEKSLANVQEYENFKEWVRTESNRMYILFDRETKWKEIYDAIFDASIALVDKMDSRASSNRMSSSNAAPQHNATFTEDGKVTNAEFGEGKKQLNQLLYKEFNTWWDAFEKEADEDHSEDAPTAQQRWTLHTSKILSRKTQIPIDSLIPIVDAWLESHLEHLA